MKRRTWLRRPEPSTRQACSASSSVRGEITPLASGLTGFPTTVAIHKRRAWVVEGQLDHHPAFGGDDQPAPPFVVRAFDLR